MSTVAPSLVPTTFSWSFDNWFHVDNLNQYLGVDFYTEDDAKGLILQFQKFAEVLQTLVHEVETGNEAEELMKLYNRLVNTNNHVLTFITSSEIKWGLHMNEMQIPDMLTIIRNAFAEVMNMNRDRDPTRTDLMRRLEKQEPITV